jgi:hypothetical protein
MDAATCKKLLSRGVTKYEPVVVHNAALTAVANVLEHANNTNANASASVAVSNARNEADGHEARVRDSWQDWLRCLTYCNIPSLLSLHSSPSLLLQLAAFGPHSEGSECKPCTVYSFPPPNDGRDANAHVLMSLHSSLPIYQSFWRGWKNPSS